MMELNPYEYCSSPDSSALLIHSGNECQSSDTNLCNSQGLITLQECHERVVNNGGQFFVWDAVGNKKCNCFQEHTTSSSCPEGWDINDPNNWNFYKVANTLAFGDCGPTGPVIDNAIGADGTSFLQTYAFSVLNSTKWTNFDCPEAKLSVISDSN